MLKRLLRREKPFVTIVSGLPRSGTSMMMKMLEAGGIEPLQDFERTADADNPRGYYEFERVKKLDKGDTAWVADAEGKAVKVISALLQHLPPHHRYKVLLMRRSLDEVLASQAKMLERRQETQATEDERLKQLFNAHLQQVETWLRRQDNFELLDVDYRLLVNEPRRQLPAIARFLNNKVDVDRMAAIADPALYRNRV